MRRVSVTQRRRFTLAVAVALIIGLIWVVAAAADAPDPVDVGNKTFPTIDSATATVQILPLASGETVHRIKVTIQGGWTWTTHGSSCTDDRAGVGYAVDWNDPTQVGNEVKTITFTENGQTITEDVQVGAAAANVRNPADNVVHPTRNSKTANFTGVVDPATPGQLDSSGKLAWRGGCGVAPDSAGRYPSNPNYTTPINTKGVGVGTVNGTDQSKLPRGTWGPISHIYRRASDIGRICAITYDVHKGTAPDSNNGVGIPSGVGEVTAGGASRNTDNGSEKNSGTPLGNACPTIPVPQPNIHVVKLPKQQTVPLFGTAAFTIQVTNNGNTDLTNVQITDAQAPNCAGSLSSLAAANNSGWDGTTLSKNGSATYTCLLTNVGQAFTNIATACGDGGGTTVCDDDQAATDHRADVGLEDLSTNQDVVPNDRVSMAVDDPTTSPIEGAVNPLGGFTFTLWKDACGTASGGTAELGPLGPITGTLSGSTYSAATSNTSALSTILGATANTAGTYYWQVAYGGDTNADGTQRNAAFSKCTEYLTINNG